MDVPGYLYALFRSYKVRRANLKQEDLLCSTFVQQCVSWTLDGALKAVWFHVGNENTNSFGMNTKLKALGRISGAPDYVFVGKDKTIFLEFKSPKGVQSKNQKAFEQWCISHKIQYHIIRSIEEAKNILITSNLLVNSLI